MGKKTDWDAYYDKPVTSAKLTRKITEYKLLKIIKKKLDCNQQFQITELGGANSCFFEAINATFPHSYYHVIDNNKKGLALFQSKMVVNTSVEYQDVLEITEKNILSDVTFSVGLIEHFDTQATAVAIRAHFLSAKPGSLVIITFPTPTWLYRVTRFFAERLNLWGFPDERPLTFSEVEKVLSEYGEIEYSGINWWIILTQGIIAVRVKDEPKPLGSVF